MFVCFVSQQLVSHTEPMFTRETFDDLATVVGSFGFVNEFGKIIISQLLVHLLVNCQSRPQPQCLATASLLLWNGDRLCHTAKPGRILRGQLCVQCSAVDGADI